MHNFFIYLALFAAGITNDTCLTLYYLNAAKGKRGFCLLLALGQQLAAWSVWYLDLIHVTPGSQEQFVRIAITIFAYTISTLITVRPHDAA